MCLLRLGEACDHRCPMCSNTGRPELRILAREEAFARFEHLRGMGFRRLMITGGEPTQHPAFWPLAAAAAAAGIRWDLNTNGGLVEGPAARAVGLGLERAIVSLHDHEVGPSAEMSGISEARHLGVIRSVEALLAAGARVHLNRVIGRPNLGRLVPCLAWVHRRWGARVPVKVSFPSTAGRGGAWEGIRLRYSDVLVELRAGRDAAAALGLSLDFEATPSCVVGVAERRDMGRATWGASHYLDERDGRTVHGMAFLESMQRVYGEACTRCRAIEGCPGVAREYAREHGTGELSTL